MFHLREILLAEADTQVLGSHIAVQPPSKGAALYEVQGRKEFQQDGNRVGL